ncbi:MAG: glycosyltransferase, partial [Microthrixaceae bacterium]
ISAMIDDPAHGRLLDMHDAGAFADAIAELLEDPEQRRRISAANRERARERFDRPVFREQIAALYRRFGRPG